MKAAEAGIPVKEFCRKYGMETSDIKRLKELEAENHKLKQMFTQLSLKSQLQEGVIKKL
ncbi:MAG: hypothetical protein J6589_03805 [Snodgrassella sp.]|uniref:hypothetical protein n=1 Tax=Snodgrassella sp. TaxID=2815304 RepID=UPI0025896439|nr:hypothetical protein [Snodgrassella sp.]MCO6513574.1 hypothetical protein [Snodgrassella sp.]